MSAGGWPCWAAARSWTSRGRPPPAGCGEARERRVPPLPTPSGPAPDPRSPRRTSRGSWPSWCPRTWTRTCSSPTRRGPPSPPTPSKPSWSGASLSGTTWLWRPRPRGRRPSKSRLSPVFCLPASFLWVLGRRALRPPCSPPDCRHRPGDTKTGLGGRLAAPSSGHSPLEVTSGWGDLAQPSLQEATWRVWGTG